MSIAVKNSANSVNNTIKKNNLVMGGNPIEYGPTQTTGFYSAKVIPSVGYSGYVIYETNSSGRLRMYEMANDTELIVAVRKLGGTTVTTVNDALIWLTSNPNFFVINKPIDNIPTNGLVFYLNVSQLSSYPKSGNTFYDLSGSGFSGSLVNGPTYSSNNGGIFVLDGTNDFCSTNFNGTFTSMTIQAWFFRNGNQPSQFAGLVATRGGSGGNTSGLLLNNYGNESLGYNWNDQANTYSWNSGLVLTNQGWNFLSLVIAPTYATGFLNGTSATNSVTHTFASNFKNVAIGKDYITERYVRGSIGAVSIYNRALSADEVSQIYNTTKTRYGL